MCNGLENFLSGCRGIGNFGSCTWIELKDSLQDRIPRHVHNLQVLRVPRVSKSHMICSFVISYFFSSFTVMCKKKVTKPLQKGK